MDREANSTIRYSSVPLAPKNTIKMMIAVQNYNALDNFLLATISDLTNFVYLFVKFDIMHFK